MIKKLLNLKYLKLRKFYISRWGVELLLLGILLVPVWQFISWLYTSTSMNVDAEFIKKAMLGTVAGIMGIAIWILGASVIIINLLRDIKILMEKNVKNDRKED